jgi:hypothetical protein
MDVWMPVARMLTVLSPPHSIEAVNLAQRDAVAAGITNLQVMRLEYWDHVKPETTAKVRMRRSRP